MSDKKQKPLSVNNVAYLLMTYSLTSNDSTNENILLFKPKSQKSSNAIWSCHFSNMLTWLNSMGTCSF
jgi:hypothetical protein